MKSSATDKWEPIEDLDFDYGATHGGNPTERQLNLARDLLRLPGQFSVQVLASLFAGQYKQGFESALDAQAESIKSLADNNE